MEINELAFYSETLIAGTHRSVGPACQQYKNRGAALLDVYRSEFAACELFRRRHIHYEHPHDIAHTLSYLVGPIAGATMMAATTAVRQPSPTTPRLGKRG